MFYATLRDATSLPQQLSTRLPRASFGLDLDADRENLPLAQQLQRDLAFWIEGYYKRKRQY